MRKVRSGFTSSKDFVDKANRFRETNEKFGFTNEVLAAFATWCILNGSAQVNGCVVSNMKRTLHEVLSMKAKTQKSRELNRQVIACLCKATDEMFDEANRRSDTETAEEIVDAVRLVYEEEYKMALF